MTDEIKRGSLTVSVVTWTATWRSKPVKLTASEFRAVAVLAKRESGFASHAVIASCKLTPRQNFDDPRNVQTLMKRVRKKFRAVDPGFRQIESVYAEGYRWLPEKQPTIEHEEMRALP